jgi:hypothetical protein
MSAMFGKNIEMFDGIRRINAVTTKNVDLEISPPKHILIIFALKKCMSRGKELKTSMNTTSLIRKAITEV